jgi:hypothetical protein
MTAFIVILSIVLLTCGYFVKKGFNEWNAENPRKLPDIIVPPEIDKVEEVREEVKQFDFHSYAEYRELKVDRAVSQIHQEILILLSNATLRELWIGMRPEDMHTAIVSALTSFSDTISDEVIGEIVIATNEQVEQQRLRSLTDGNSDPA